MTPAFVVVGGLAFIGMSLWLRFTPRIRVAVAFFVGAMLAGPARDFAQTVFGKITSLLATPIGSLIGQSTSAVADALGTAIVLVMAIIVVVFMIGKYGRGGSLALAALICALLLPLYAVGVNDALRGVVS